MNYNTVVKYGAFEGYPARWNDYDAWVCWDGTWKQFPPMEVWGNAHVLSEAKYHAEFDPVPSLPKAAFQGSE